MLEVNQAVTGGQMWHSPTWIFSAIASLLISSESGVRVEPRNWLALIECQASFFRRERKKSMHTCVKSAEAELEQVSGIGHAALHTSCDAIYSAKVYTIGPR